MENLLSLLDFHNMLLIIRNGSVFPLKKIPLGIP